MALPGRNTRRAWTAAVLLASLLAAAPARAEDYAQWAHTGDVLLNTTAGGANVTGTVTRFPVLVRLDAGSFDFRQARGDGRDIRFASSAGRHLPYQIDRWDSARAAAEVWVLADTVRGDNATQFLRMHWGNPAAADSGDGNAVFGRDNAYLGVWHLGTETDARPNSTAWGKPALPQGYGTDPAVPGVIGTCDSLNNDAGAEDYLYLQDNYSEISQGFTYEVWTYPTAVTGQGRLLDLGSGPGRDNITVSRLGTSNDLAVGIYVGTTKVLVFSASGALQLNQWQHFAVTVSGLQARIYRNGALVAEGTLTSAIPAVQRTSQYIGRSNWTNDKYYQGKIDEPRISMKARSADWIKLSHANQKAGQTLVSIRRSSPSTCSPVFAPPRDTSLSEGSLLELTARADCATSYTWSAVSGSVPRIFDPDVKTLQVYLPRVTADQVLVYRFLARFPDSILTKDVRVTVREAIPDPAFRLGPLPAWNGRDSLVVKPVITNLAAVKASRDSIIEWNWTVSGPSVDTAWRRDALVLRNPAAGRIAIGLCLDNNGPPVCAQTSVDVSSLAGLAALPRPGARASAARDYPDAAGRMGRGSPGSPVVRFIFAP